MLHQEECDLFFLYCDFNGHCGKLSDFILGVDTISERQVLDASVIMYGEILCNFLVSSDCCMLNGHNNIRNLYTFKDISLIDYCIKPTSCS